MAPPSDGRALRRPELGTNAPRRSALGWATFGAWLLAPWLGIGGCEGFVPRPERPASVGHAANGTLAHGLSLPDRGPGFVRGRPGESTRFGTDDTLAAITEAAAAVDRAFPGSRPLRVGDLSAPLGGRHPRHGSHRTGRDVDVMFYALDVEGVPIDGTGTFSYDRFGIGFERAGEGGEARFSMFDTARNWHFVRALLADDRRPVQWIFCSRGVKARLLAYAARVEPSPDVLFRAAWVLHQPSRGNPHADHFHVRFACTASARSDGCTDGEPIWPWYAPAHEKAPFTPRGPSDDDALVTALLEDIAP